MLVNWQHPSGAMKSEHEEIPDRGMNRIWHRVIMLILLIAALVIVWNVLGGR